MREIINHNLKGPIMPKVRSGAAQKYVERAATSGSAYAAGVQSPRTPWEAATLAAVSNQAEASQRAIAEKRFEKGVRKAGNSKYTQGAVEKGVSRFSQGVQMAESAYATGIAPYFQVIEATNLPPKYPKGDPRNYERSKVIGTALNAKKKTM